MTLANIIELAILALAVIVIVSLRIYTSRRLNAIDGCGAVTRKGDSRSHTIDL